MAFAKRGASKGVAKRGGKKEAPSAAVAKKAPVKPRAEAKPRANASARPSVETLEQVVFFSAPPEVIYRALTDSRQHAEFTGVAAEKGAVVGSAFRAERGYVRGETLELVPNERIVQRWRASDFPAGYPDARLEVTLVPDSGGTKLCLSHQKLPRQHAQRYDEAWKECYWRPLRAYLAQRENG